MASTATLISIHRAGLHTAATAANFQERKARALWVDHNSSGMDCVASEARNAEALAAAHRAVATAHRRQLARLA